MTREEAIEILEEVKNFDDSMYQFIPAYNEALDMAIKALGQEPKTGHWTEKEHNFEKCWAECSVCGKTARGYSKDTGWGFTYSYTDYCPNCGARMESEDT